MADSNIPPERRPIATRDLRISAWLARRLVELGVSANAISLAGMVCGLAGGGLLAATSFAADQARWCWLVAGVCIQLRLAANMLDGMVALATGKTSPLGELYNEVPDRISDSAVFIGAGYAVGGDVVLGWAAACLAVFTAYVRAMGKAAGAPQEYCGPMAKPQRMFVMTLLCLFGVLAPADWHFPLPAAPHLGLTSAVLMLIIIGSLATALRRLVRIARHLKRRPPS